MATPQGEMLQQLGADDLEDLLNDIQARAQKYEFKVAQDNAAECIRDSAGLLGYYPELSDALVLSLIPKVIARCNGDMDEDAVEPTPQQAVAVVKVTVVATVRHGTDTVVADVMSEADYSFTSDTDGARITETEMTGFDTLSSADTVTTVSVAFSLRMELDEAKTCPAAVITEMDYTLASADAEAAVINATEIRDFEVVSQQPAPAASSDSDEVYTVIPYLYRDADNYKACGQIVLEGWLSTADLALIESTLQDGEFFIPADLAGCDIAELQSSLTSFPSIADHVYHELNLEEREQVNTIAEEVTTIPACAFVEAFRRVANPDGWDVSAAVERLGIM